MLYSHWEIFSVMPEEAVTELSVRETIKKSDATESIV